MAAGSLVFYNNLRNRLLTYVGSNGTTIGSILSGTLYIGSAPEGAEFPYGVMRFINAGTSGETDGAKVVGALEVTFVAFPHNRAAQRAVETLADLADQAMLRYRSHLDSGVGLVYSRYRINRDTLPVSAANAAMTRSMFAINYWPEYLAITSGTFQ